VILRYIPRPSSEIFISVYADAQRSSLTDMATTSAAVRSSMSSSPCRRRGPPPARPRSVPAACRPMYRAAIGRSAPQRLSGYGAAVARVRADDWAHAGPCEISTGDFFSSRRLGNPMQPNPFDDDGGSFDVLLSMRNSTACGRLSPMFRRLAGGLR
jgi:hypothetical protein